MADVRTGKRFPVELPIRIHVSNSDQEQAGTTANLSAAGVFLKASAVKAKSPTGQKRRTPGTSAKAGAKNKPSQTLRRGAVVEFDLTLPAAAIGATQDIHIQCRGRVVRVEQPSGSDSRDGVACVIDKYEFVRKA